MSHLHARPMAKYRLNPSGPSQEQQRKTMSSNSPFQAAEIVRARIPADFKPRVAMILGSGLGVLAEQMSDAVTIGFDELPGFPISTVHGHAGELVIGTLAGVSVVCMKGRGHVYEGYGLGVMTSAVRTMKLLGCEMLFVTNAAGSLRPEVDAGSLVALLIWIYYSAQIFFLGAEFTRQFTLQLGSMKDAPKTEDGDLVTKVLKRHQS